jgi:hypothetical protein
MTMLFNPRWNKRKPKPGLDGFIAWLEMQDSKKRYIWLSERECACGQYAASLGITRWWGRLRAWWAINDIAYGNGEPVDWTFGACLERAKAYRDQGVIVCCGGDD